MLNEAQVLTLKTRDVLFREGGQDERACYLLESEIQAEGRGTPRRSIAVDADSLRCALDNLRPRPFTAGELDPARPLITYCDTGARSKVAAFLLCQRGLNAQFLEGGLSALQERG